MLERVRYARARADRWAGERLARPVRTGAGPREGVAITFDDGPDPDFTPRILDVLAGRGAPATFFLVGDKARRHGELVRRIVAEGHGIGSHSRSHPDMWTVSRSEVRRQYVEGRRLVEAAAGRPVPLVRPPKGWLDARAGAVLRRDGFRTVLWDATGDDWVPGVTAEQILAAVGPPRPGSIILLHDAIERAEDPAQLDRGATVDAVGPLVDRVRASGHEVVALT